MSEKATEKLTAEIERPAEKVSARVINNTIRYTVWTSLKLNNRELLGADPAANSSQVEALFESLAEDDVILRGAYDISALRAGADLMLWMHAPTAEAIQSALRKFHATSFGSAFEQVWSAMGLHRPAEFNKSHVPAFMSGAGAKDWLCVYPFVRSYEWYLLPEEERRRMLVQHGMAGRNFGGILSNTVASFALGDYEWILALESDELHEIVDMMRELRSTDARRHVREEIPFFTGRLLNLSTISEHYA